VKAPGHHHVARLIDLAEQTGIALDHAIGREREARGGWLGGWR
jgi:hypothetical protein